MSAQADFKEMLKSLMLRYGIQEMDLLQKASSPKLEPLGISSLMPSKDDLGTTGKGIPANPPPVRNSNSVDVALLR